MELNHANEKFEWTYSKQEAFDKIKPAVVEVARLAHPRPGKPFVIDCDACKDGLGAVLAQADEQGRECPIVFASTLLRPKESRRTTTELAYAVVWAHDSFSAYVEGSPTLVRTDQRPFPGIRSNFGNSAKVARWVLALPDFSFDLKHRARKCHNASDALSRKAAGEPAADTEDLMCYARESGRIGVCATATQPTPLLDMSREQHRLTFRTQVSCTCSQIVHPPMDSPRPQLPEALPAVFSSRHNSSVQRQDLPLTAACSVGSTLPPAIRHSAVMSLSSLSDKERVRFVVHHLRGDALLWWLELSESNRSQHLLDDWTAFKSALRRRFVQWNAASSNTQKLL
ncbi:hypothetical protein Efla_003585 [Eimeria flavescens]